MCQGKRSERKKFFVFLSIQLPSSAFKKIPEDTQRHVRATGLLCALQLKQGQLLRGQGTALYDGVMFDFNRTKSILKTIKDTPIP